MGMMKINGGMSKPNQAIKHVAKKTEWKCVQCGSCCFMYGCMVPASDDDLARWKEQGRDDILEKAKVVTDPKTGRIIAAELWFNPHTGREYVYCPWIKRKPKGKAAWLRKWKDADKVCVKPPQLQRPAAGVDKQDRVICMIHDTKPQYCRDYICRKHKK